MTFLNRNLLSYAAIALLATLTIYWLSLREGTPQWVLGVSTMIYIAVIVLCTILFSRRDPYQYFGFNYHFITYLICLAVPLLLHAAGYLPDISYVGTMAGTWGIGIVIHFIIFLALAKKRRLKGYDKGEIFS
jgi:hypothetical protein